MKHTTNVYKPFLGKVCTILTQTTSLPIRDSKQHAEYFTGEVVDVTEEGITIKHLNIGTYAFYTFPIIGIVEEQAISKNDPNYDKLVEEINKKAKPKPINGGHPSIPQKSSVALSIDDMTKMAKDIKNAKTKGNMENGQ